MLDRSIISQLKQVNVGKNPEKIMERVRALWKDLDNPTRQEILDMADIKKFTVERTYKQGTISAKLVAAMSLVLCIDPLYLTGEEDEERDFSEDLVDAFLRNLNYGDLLDGTSKNKRRYRKNGAEVLPLFDEEEEEEEDEDSLFDNPVLALFVLAEHLSEAMSEEDQARFAAMSEEELVFLLKSLTMRAQFNDEMKHILNFIKYVLVQ